MSEYLKGNFKIALKKGTSTPNDAKQDVKESLKEEFERRALEKLGGSIAFVVKPSLIWKGD